VIVLPLRRLEDSVTVSRDRQEAAADRSLSFGTALTREQLDALSEDPDEMRRQLMDMAGPDAVIRVDSFEGQQLPPKAQIKSVRIHARSVRRREPLRRRF
jgi:lactam utilization protein B